MRQRRRQRQQRARPLYLLLLLLPLRFLLLMLLLLLLHYLRTYLYVLHPAHSTYLSVGYLALALAAAAAGGDGSDAPGSDGWSRWSETVSLCFAGPFERSCGVSPGASGARGGGRRAGSYSRIHFC
jgi:hypothetical protein